VYCWSKFLDDMCNGLVVLLVILDEYAEQFCGVFLVDLLAVDVELDFLVVLVGVEDCVVCFGWVGD